jgi:hypothetical protein
MADLNLNFQRQALARSIGHASATQDLTTTMRTFLDTAHAANASRKDLTTEFNIRSQFTRCVLADSPVEYWKLGETGSPYADSGSANKQVTGTVTASIAGPVVDLGTTGLTVPTGVSFSGSQSLITANTDPLTGATAASMECWVNFNGTQNLGSTNACVNPSTVGHYLGVSTLGRVLASFVISGTQRTQQPTSGIIPTTGWHHLVATWATGDSIRCYMDGTLAPGATSATFSGTLDAGAGGICLGAFNSPAPLLFLTGQLAHAAIYTTQLSAVQVATHYAGR